MRRFTTALLFCALSFTSSAVNSADADWKLLFNKEEGKGYVDKKSIETDKENKTLALLTKFEPKKSPDGMLYSLSVYFLDCGNARMYVLDQYLVYPKGTVRLQMPHPLVGNIEKDTPAKQLCKESFGELTPKPQPKQLEKNQIGV